jgi:uncharacterized protein (DUF58 family)
MIVPTHRLLFWTCVVVLPFSVLATTLPATTVLSVAFIAALLLLAVLDAGLGCGKLEGLTFDFPQVVRLSKDRAGVLEMRIRNTSQKARRLRLGLPMPEEVRCSMEETRVALPAGSEFSRLEWPCQPSRRGRYLLKKIFVERSSPLGFWDVRDSLPLTSEIRVYPNLLKDRNKLAPLFLNRGALGLHAQRQVGKGRDFEKLREYSPGDSYDEIHWKATARRGHPITKVYQIERTQEIYVILDASRLSSRALKGSSAGAADVVLERFVTAALVLGLAAEQQGDLFGLAAFSDKLETFVRAKNGQNHYGLCRDALYSIQPKIVSPDFEELATFIRLRLRRRALLIFLTSLDDPVLAESFIRNVGLLSGQHLVLVNMLKPPDAEPLFSRGDVQSEDDLYRELGAHLRWSNLRELEKILQRRGIKFSLIDNERFSVDLVSQYLRVKQRQLL